MFEPEFFDVLRGELAELDIGASYVVTRQADGFTSRLVPASAPWQWPRVCVICDKPFLAGQKKGKYCSSSCRVRAHRASKAGE